MKTILKLGTRKSLLAWAQSSWVARELTRVHANQGREISVELVGIETQGDKILDKPLSQMEGKEFFTAELDRALLKGDVDFTVHSMKDLSLERPSALKLAATPAREFSHDLAVFNSSVTDRLRQGLPIRVGTSSPRRLTLIPELLKKTLPRFSNEPVLKFVEIRGNVNTRLSRVHEVENSEKKLDGVILAFAGLERLAQDATASLELARLLKNTRFMILPLRENPTAPAQGALAVECCTEDVVKLISVLHDPETLMAVAKERTILGEWGGGCHQKLGASYLASGHLLIKGEKPSGEKVSETRGETPNTLPASFTRVETDELFSFNAFSPNAEQIQKLKSSDSVFIAHIRAFEFLSDELKSLLGTKRIWASGMQSWQKLAAKGIWVEGCTEGLGIKALEPFIAKKFFSLVGSFANWSFLTHTESVQMNPHFSFSITPVPTYAHQFKSVPAKITSAQQLFWSSGLVFSKVLENLSDSEKKSFLQKTHACGPGRTQNVLIQHGIKPQIFVGAN